jgi:hypothetical protein
MWKKRVGAIVVVVQRWSDATEYDQGSVLGHQH